MASRKSNKDVTDSTKYPKIGDGVDSEIQFLSLEGFDAIDPKTYFATSGEAVAKAEQLDKDAWKLAGMTRKLLNDLKKARSDAKFLEISWEDMNGVRALVARRKNPRAK